MSRKRDLFLFPKYSTRSDHSCHYFITHFQCSSSKQEFCLFVKTHLRFPSITDSAYMNQTPNNSNKQIKVANHHIKTKITKLFPPFSLTPNLSCNYPQATSSSCSSTSNSFCPSPSTHCIRTCLLSHGKYHRKSMLTADPNFSPVLWSNWKRRKNCMSAFQSGSVDKGDLQP